MPNTIQLKTSQIAGVEPSAAQLVLGELAVNAADGKLFLKRTNNSVVCVGQDNSLFLNRANDLSDLPSAATARTNLGLGTAATQDSTFFLQSANNLSDLSNATTARTNLGLGAAATQPLTAFLQPGNNLSELTASAATARTNLGLGTMATQSATSINVSGGTLTNLGNLRLGRGGGFLFTTSGASIDPRLLSFSTNAAAGAHFFANTGSNNTTSQVIFGKSRGLTGTTPGVVSAGDPLGIITFAAGDGVQFLDSARIRVVAESASNTNFVPSTLSFQTGAAGTPATRLEIDSLGTIRFSSGNIRFVEQNIEEFRTTTKPLTRASGAAISTGDRWYHPEDKEWYFWNGTYWLTENKRLWSHSIQWSNNPGFNAATHHLPGNINFPGTSTLPWHLFLDSWTVGYSNNSVVQNSSNRVAVQLFRSTPANVITQLGVYIPTNLTTINTVEISTQTLNLYIDPVATSTRRFELIYSSPSPSTSGLVTINSELHYRLVRP